MALEVPSPITPNADLNIHEAGGIAIALKLQTNDEFENVSAKDVYFECGSTLRVKLVAASSVLLTLTLTPENVELIRKNGPGANFVVVDETTAPFRVLWEGIVYIRSTD